MKTGYWCLSFRWCCCCIWCFAREALPDRFHQGEFPGAVGCSGTGQGILVALGECCSVGVNKVNGPFSHKMRLFHKARGQTHLLAAWYSPYHEFHETYHSITFYFMKKRLQTMLWHHYARVNSHQRWKQTRFRVCFHLWCELTSTMKVTEWQVSWNSWRMREQGTDGCGLINHVTTPWDAEIASINCPIDAASAADKEDSEGQCALD